jgi:hypothetical protein
MVKKDKKTVIYSIRNFKNSKIYIGATTSTLSQAFSQHKRIYKQGTSPQNPLYKAFAEVDLSYFYIQSEGTYQCNDKNETNKILTEYYIKYDTIKNGYNGYERTRKPKEHDVELCGIKSYHTSNTDVTCPQDAEDTQDVQDAEETTIDSKQAFMNEDNELTRLKLNNTPYDTEDEEYEETFKYDSNEYPLLHPQDDEYEDDECEQRNEKDDDSDASYTSDQCYKLMEALSELDADDTEHEINKLSKKNLIIFNDFLERPDEYFAKYDE